MSRGGISCFQSSANTPHGTQIQIYKGAYFFGDYSRGTLQCLHFNKNLTIAKHEVFGNASGVIAFEPAADGSFYYSVRNGRSTEIRQVRYDVASTRNSDATESTVSENPIQPTLHVKPVSIISPADGDTYAAGDEITLEADECINCNYAWYIELVHGDHTHPATNVIGRVGSITTHVHGHSYYGVEGLQILLVFSSYV